MKIETFIKNEVRKYKDEVITNKKKGICLDKLERLMRQHEKNCIEFIEKQEISSYTEACRYKDLARKALQEVDDVAFGCFNASGKCIGYNFYQPNSQLPTVYRGGGLLALFDKNLTY